MKKGLFFLLFILILPTVNAFFDLRGIYTSYPEWFDFLVFFAIFGIIARISFGRFFGKDEPLQKALSVVVAFALAFSGVYFGYLSLSRIGEFFSTFAPIFWLLVAVLLFFGLYRFVKWVFKRTWLSFLVTIIISLCLISIIFPESILRRIPIDIDFIGNIISFLAILFIIFLVFGLIFLGSRKLREWSSRSTKHLKEEEKIGEEGKGEEKTKEKKIKKLKVFIKNPKPRFLSRIIKVEPKKRIKFIGIAKGGSGKYSYYWQLDGRTQEGSLSTFNTPLDSEGRYNLRLQVEDSNGNKAKSKVYVIDVKAPVKKVRKLKEITAEINRNWPGRTPKRGTREYSEWKELYDEAEKIRKRL